MKQWQKFCVWFVYACLLEIPCELIKYFLANNMLNKWYFIGAGLIFMFLGWLGYHLELKTAMPRKSKK